ncbi:ABC transporter ATP-binding protein [Cytobacillus dafuensis]|uniref:ABC transporter ATP-binding protein n=1 Tax=Cytobacillus dafuensis TaxID=1742359 RepID=A0A5B8Z1Y4_CYTDA|nr:ABC transporter ATP-binding protein [Cytobacillus dafuensis]QED47042.1 ABC transporter ATP-binding protein [Cytobacillus dafuensis]
MTVSHKETLLGNSSSTLDSKSPAVISIEQVNKRYQSSTIALENVNLQIHNREFISFVGPSGCGKSTLLRMIAGLGEPTNGNISVLGTTPEIARQKNGEVAFVFQESTLLPWRSVYQNVILPLELSGVSKKVQKEEGYRVLELVGLKDHVKALPNQLSGGMRMRVSIARALIAKPKLLLMDEPFGALDEITRQNLQNELLNIWEKEELTVLFVTHNVFESVFISNRIAIMTPRPGKISALIDVDLPYPREENLRSTHRFSELVATVSEKLKH